MTNLRSEVVSNTSPIIYLSAIGQIDLARQLYGTIAIPQAVYDELTVDRSAPGAAEAQGLDWIVVVPIQDQHYVQYLQTTYDAMDIGEAEAITLAFEQAARLIILDNLAPRRVAQALTLNVTGTLGVLRDARTASLISEVRPLVDAMIQVGFYIHPNFYQQFLHDLGE